MWRKVGLTGHRGRDITYQQETWIRTELHKAAVWLRDRHGTRIGISGMAYGCDLWWAEAVLAAGLTLAAYLPCTQQTATWPAATKRLHRQLLELADPRHSRTFADQYREEALRDRNQGMIDDSDALLAVWDPARRRGGTWSAVCYAAKKSKPGIHLNPAIGTIRMRLPSREELHPHGRHQKPDPLFTL